MKRRDERVEHVRAERWLHMNARSRCAILRYLSYTVGISVVPDGMMRSSKHNYRSHYPKIHDTVSKPIFSIIAWTRVPSPPLIRDDLACAIIKSSKQECMKAGVGARLALMKRSIRVRGMAILGFHAVSRMRNQDIRACVRR